ncbi:DUF7344 domain-containing protein [Halobellus salinisoli]|uniref:DUF7344 domain-containing protein n=1 Tax=Halobellus salinisoli TaxID=3108500 RepID=UPI00300AA545
MSPHEPQTLSQDTAFDLLSNARRRFVLRRLQQQRGGIELSDLAEELAAEENGLAPPELSAQQRKRTYVSLYQTHIPKLADANVVRYDSETGMVYSTRHVDELAQYFEDEREPIPWQLIYASVAVVGLAGYLFSSLLDFSVVRPEYVAVVILVGLVLVSVLHYAYANRLLTNSATIPLENDSNHNE